MRAIKPRGSGCFANGWHWHAAMTGRELLIDYLQRWNRKPRFRERERFSTFALPARQTYA